MGERSCQYTVFSEIFAGNGDLTTHMRWDTTFMGKRSNQLNGCLKTFTQKINMTKHTRGYCKCESLVPMWHQLNAAFSTWILNNTCNDLFKPNWSIVKVFLAYYYTYKLLILRGAKDLLIFRVYLNFFGINFLGSKLHLKDSFSPFIHLKLQLAGIFNRLFFSIHKSFSNTSEKLSNFWEKSVKIGENIKNLFEEISNHNETLSTVKKMSCFLDKKTFGKHFEKKNFQKLDE